jgi:hypothetical protein
MSSSGNARSCVHIVLCSLHSYTASIASTPCRYCSAATAVIVSLLQGAVASATSTGSIISTAARCHTAVAQLLLTVVLLLTGGNTVTMCRCG